MPPPPDCCLLSGCRADGDILSELVYSKVSLSPAGDNPEARAALDHGDNERELNHGSVNLSLLSVTQTRCPEAASSPGHLYVCMFTVVEPRLSRVKAGVIPQTNEWQWRTHTHTHNLRRHCKHETEKEAGLGLTPALQHCDSPAMLDPRQHHSARRVQAKLANSSGPTLSSPSLARSRSDSAVGVSPGLSFSQGLHS